MIKKATIQIGEDTFEATEENGVTTGDLCFGGIKQTIRQPVSLEGLLYVVLKAFVEGQDPERAGKELRLQVLREMLERAGG